MKRASSSAIGAGSHEWWAPGMIFVTAPGIESAMSAEDAIISSKVCSPCIVTTGTPIVANSSACGADAAHPSDSASARWLPMAATIEGYPGDCFAPASHSGGMSFMYHSSAGSSSQASRSRRNSATHARASARSPAIGASQSASPVTGRPRTAAARAMEQPDE